MRYWGSSLLTAGKVKWYRCYFVIIVSCSSSKVYFFVLRQECLISVNTPPLKALRLLAGAQLQQSSVLRLVL